MNDETPRDFLGNPLGIGDTIVRMHHTRTSSTLYKDVIIKFSPKMIFCESGTRVMYSKVIRS